MGVLHMAIPARGIVVRTPRDGGRTAAAQNTNRQALKQPIPNPRVSDGTRPAPEEIALHRTPANSAWPRHEVTLQRTSESEWESERAAEQEALGRLVRQCIAGDQQAWQQLVVSQHRRIYAICYRFTGSASDAEDLTQDVFLKLYRNLASFDGHKGSFQTWITTLARNLLVDHFRRTRMDRASESLDASCVGSED
ncbi:MAG TPA: sigma-70 family RNA polymerase sigma factor, partial [Acidobacteriaceae bacterium]|nr:sigma-70 family RNA polymerase sigma factor [Acidobacteriaceae bacterium]